MFLNVFLHFHLTLNVLKCFSIQFHFFLFWLSIVFIMLTFLESKYFHKKLHSWLLWFGINKFGRASWMSCLACAIFLLPMAILVQGAPRVLVNAQAYSIMAPLSDDDGGCASASGTGSGTWCQLSMHEGFLKWGENMASLIDTSCAQVLVSLSQGGNFSCYCGVLQCQGQALPYCDVQFQWFSAQPFELLEEAS